eukprot:Gregarina_sp_Poly_1__7555@NODE_422_length_8655_cov_206_021076_g344_i0_p4_GENE_NODE_422_length_8655_cov_206_021076_g344_i0NODE_422_length_8655_cov_206_021076_g344_i0_p4_ORF_typecomplete_len232_score22_89_NODE_422_length_8655_cov_206_021076_g344_i051955890
MSIGNALTVMSIELRLITEAAWTLIQSHLMNSEEESGFKDNVLITDEMRNLHPLFHNLVGASVHLEVPEAGPYSIYLPGGWHIAHTLWTSRNYVYSAVCCALISVGFFTVSLLIPPIRSLSEISRNALVVITDGTKRFLEDCYSTFQFNYSDVEPIDSMPSLDSRLRLTEEVNASALNTVSTAVAASMFERLFFSPWGVNSAVATMPLIAHLKSAAFPHTHITASLDFRIV